MHRIAVSLVLLGALAAPAPAQERPAQTPPERDAGGEGAEPLPETENDDAEERAAEDLIPLPDAEQVLELSLHDAVELALENNLDLRVARHQPLIADEDAAIALGVYDPELLAEYGFNDDETPTLSLLQPGQLTTQTTTSDGDLGAQGLVPRLGSFYELRYHGQRVKTTRSFQILSPEYRSRWSATVTQPLLRGLWWGDPWTRVKTARIASRTAEEQFRRQLMDEVQSVEQGYWNLTAAAQQLRVAEKSLETARALLEQTRIQYDVGVISRVEVTEARAGVAAREVDRIRAANAYRDAQDALIDRVLGPRLGPVSELAILPTDEPETVTVREVDLEVAAEKAYDNRPELAAARRDIESRRVELANARNQRLPQLDLVGAYGVESQAGRLNPALRQFADGDGDGVTPEQLVNVVPDDFGGSLDNLNDPAGANRWSLRAVLTFPLGNIEGQHGVSRSKLELRRSLSQAQRVRQSIILELRDATRELRTALERIEAAKRQQEAAAEQLRAERVRLRHGESTPFAVLEREQDLVQAESELIDAYRSYHVAVAAVERAQGTTLKSRNIVVEEALELR